MAVKSWIGWGLALSGVLAAGPLVLGRGHPADTSALDEIAVMSKVERVTLQRKYDQYRALTEKQRADLRLLHQAIEADRLTGARDLAAMQDYCDWLKMISPWQQDELAHITDPQQKAKRVAEIAQARKAEASATETRGEKLGPLGNGLAEIPSLTGSQLTKVFDVLAKRLTDLTEEEQKEIEGQKGLKRFGVQIKYLKKSIPNPEKFFQSISDAELAEMISASENPELNSLLGDSVEASFRRRVATVAIFTSCRAQSMRESASATTAELETYFNTLPEDVQDKLFQLSAEEFKTQLRLRRLESDPDVSELRHLMGAQFSSATRRMEKLRSEGMLGPGGPGPGPGGPGPGGRPFDGPGDRPPERRREGDRGGPTPRPLRAPPPRPEKSSPGF